MGETITYSIGICFPRTLASIVIAMTFVVIGRFEPDTTGTVYTCYMALPWVQRHFRWSISFDENITIDTALIFPVSGAATELQQ
ncbi:MAG: hypothetical protein HC893_16785 [Chloroflexaceae bacterium]|nr:hypothetical protein [Chloroflexaceae bacterium]NJL35199.1 hypothetical protein [Chloroflexaceae bacterium]NJO05213.1 hypothetical protein [Chloroflexaceae bacterium]